MKIFNLLFCLIFIFFAALQYNDPDPYVWMPVYLYAAGLCWLAFRNKFFPLANLIGITVYTVYAIYLFVAADGVWDWITVHKAASIVGEMKASQPWIEQTREFFGLVILIVVLTINYNYGKKKMKQQPI